MSFVSGAAKALVPYQSAIQSTDKFNDYVGAKHIGGARLISGGVQAFAYGDAARLVGAEAVDSAQEAYAKFAEGDIANGIGYSMLTAAEGMATSLLATHAVAAVVTAVNAKAADAKLDK